MEVGKLTVEVRTVLGKNESRRLRTSGKVPGNGGGAPVEINGWVCQGFSTPKVLATGQTSACRKAGQEILAVLPSPSPSASSS